MALRFAVFCLTIGLLSPVQLGAQDPAEVPVAPVPEFTPRIPAPASWSVNGFHGYRWGTPRADIDEVRGAEVHGRGSARVYAADVEMLGHLGSALFYFDSGTDRLYEGGYLFSLQVVNCERTWDEFESALAEAYGGLRVVRTQDKSESYNRRVYDSYCDFYIYNDDKADWITGFQNPETGLVELGMIMSASRLSPQLAIMYYSPKSLMERDEDEASDKDKLGPVN